MNHNMKTIYYFTYLINFELPDQFNMLKRTLNWQKMRY